MSQCSEIGPDADGPQPTAEQEARIMAMVRRFYELCLEDDLLGPMFRATIDDFEEHYGIVQDFWSHALLGTTRYKRGTPFTHHLNLKVEEAHFARWMQAFTRAVSETLPFPLDALALKRAEHMTHSFKAGLLPLPTPGRVTIQ